MNYNFYRCTVSNPTYDNLFFFEGYVNPWNYADQLKNYLGEHFSVEVLYAVGNNARLRVINLKGWF